MIPLTAAIMTAIFAMDLSNRIAANAFISTNLR
jgi:hypothetical protein